MVSQPLCRAFLAHAGLQPVSDTEAEKLEEFLTTRTEDARARWGLCAHAEEFVRYLAEKVRGEPDPRATLAKLHIADLLLAFGCVRQDPKALASFESAFFQDIGIALRTLAADQSHVDDIQQRLRVKLFIGDDGAAPKITEYAGRGDLRNWFRVTAVRQAISEARKTRREVPLEEAVADAAPSTAPDPELAYLRTKYEGEFQRAFRSAVAGLSSHERNLLRHHYIDRLSIDQIGAIYRIHRMTAARRLTAVRQRVVDCTRQHLAENAKLSASELRSVLQLVKSEMHVSLRRVLDTGTGPDLCG
jgi:RNA polymerase sigma-70 factor (ECF subfamily)